MNEQPRDPAYRAALDSANAELRELAETLHRIRMRQEQIAVAIESLKGLVSSPALVIDSSLPAAPAKPIYAMNTANSPVKKTEKVQALA